MKRLLLLISCVFIFISSSSQIILTNDTSFCSPQAIDLYALSAIQSSMAVDDMHDGVVDIGFDFDFYGNTYNKCVISGNGYITFDTTLANTGSPWSINLPIPNPGSVPENAILAPWQDIHTGVSGSIYYGTTGAAPNRMFTVTWCEVAMFSCTSLLHTSQVVIHEGSNKIEMFIQDKPLCITWNTGAAIQGLVDATSTNFDIVDDPILFLPRNFPLTWTATNEGWEFLPNTSMTGYTINQIPYVPIIAGAATWTDASGTVIGVGPTVPVNPTTTTTYYCSVTGDCSNSTLVDSVTISVTGCIDINLTSTQSSCLGTDGTISVTPDLSTTSPPWMIELQNMNGVNVQVANNIMNSTYIFSNVVTGSYIVKITELPLIGNPNSSQDTIVVTQIQNPIALSTNAQNVQCYGGSNGTISVIPQGGALPYQFYINGFPATNPYPYDSVFTNLIPGTYIMSVIDANNCMDKDTVVITEPAFPLQLSPTSKLLNCHGETSGFATATCIGGTPSYFYEWFDGSYTSIGTGDSISGLVGGSYFVKVTDANGCDTVETIQILQVQTALTSNNQIFGVPCVGDSTGMIVSQAIGSQGPYRYYWFTPSGDSIIQSNTDQFLFARDTLKNLLAGTYDLHLYDANGCFESYTMTVGEASSALVIDSIVVSNTVTCFGGNNGAAQTFVGGGMPNYYFSWDNGELTSNATQLTSGYHTVQLTDDWGCVVEDSIYISENSEIISTIVVDNEVSCYGLSDGSVSVTSVGGSPNYTYFWSNLSTSNTGTSSTNSGLIYGSYYLTTQDIYGCNVFDTILVDQPDPLFVEASEIDSISCYGYDDGVAYAYGGGGTEPYTFYWDSLTGYSGDTNFMLSPGIHTVYIVDSRGCEAMDTVFTNEPPVFEVDILDSLTILPYCIGVNSASLTSLANGGTPPYWYEWDDNAVTPQTTPTASNLLAGIYTITVTDSRGCVVSETRDIDTITNTMTSDIYAPLTYSGGYHVSCYGANDGMLYVVGGGTDHLPFSYQWYGPNGFISFNDSITSIEAGTYSVTILDSNLCASNTSFNITTPDALQYTIISLLRDESCEGACNGQIMVDLTGGTPPYIGTSTDVSTGHVLTSTMIGDTILEDMCSGTWNIELTDANGCSSSVSPGGVNNQTVGYTHQTVAQVGTIVHVDCYGTSTGSLNVFNPNTNPNYSYNWENINSPGVSLGTGNTITNLPAGLYVLMAEYGDSLSIFTYDGCTTTDTVEITEIDEIHIQANITDVDCYGNNTGDIEVFVTGGTASYTLQWNPTGTSGNTLNNLISGFYALSVTDANGCLRVDTFQIMEPPFLSVNISQNSINSSVLEANVIGGVPSYTYKWKEFNTSGVLQQGGISYTVLAPGSYYVEVEDNNDCSSESDTITFNETVPTSSNLLSNLDISIYPNPFRDYTIVDFGKQVMEGEVKVIDMLGNVVDIYDVEEQRELIIDRNTKSKGVYFVEILINSDKMFKKITVQ